MKVYAIPLKSLKRKEYSSADELAEEILDFLTENPSRTATLATDFRWWAKQPVDPYIGHVTNVSLGFAGKFLEDDILKALRKRGILVKNVKIQHNPPTEVYWESWYYFLKKSL